jgi:hypothetical protein
VFTTNQTNVLGGMKLKKRMRQFILAFVLIIGLGLTSFDPGTITPDEEELPEYGYILPNSI